MLHSSVLVLSRHRLAFTSLAQAPALDHGLHQRWALVRGGVTAWTVALTLSVDLAATAAWLDQ